MPIEVLSNYESVAAEDLCPALIAPGIFRVSIKKYLRDKVQCLVERNEARDLTDIGAVLTRFPDLQAAAREEVSKLDLVLLSERLLGWSERELAADLARYEDVEVAQAQRVRDLILSWVAELK